MIVCRPIVGQNGFGNEFLNVAKALVCAKEMGARFLKPRWPAPYEQLLTGEFNEQNLLRHRLRFLRYRLTHRPIEIDQPFCERMQEVSITDGVRRYLREQGIAPRANILLRFTYFPQVRLTPGMGCVIHQMDYLKEVLLRNPAIAHEVEERLRRLGRDRLSVGVHIRRGDFLPEIPLGVRWPIGTNGLDEWCNRVPIAWFRQMCSLLRQTFGDRVQFFLASNGSDAEVTEFEREFSCSRGIGTEERTPRDVVDLLTLAGTDLMIASPSWFSLWALSFSNRPFLWYDPAYTPPEYLTRRQPCFSLRGETAIPPALKEYGAGILRLRGS
jgi:hypothetical protein